MDNLSGLRDIHLPENSSFLWPLAYGWWTVLLVMAGIAAAYYIGKKIRRTSARFYAQRILLSLKEDTDLAAAVKMSEILRRACVRQYPEAVALYGKEWIAFLNQKSKNSLDAKTAELLCDAPFVTSESKMFQAEDMQKLWQFCYAWIGENL